MFIKQLTLAAVICSVSVMSFAEKLATLEFDRVIIFGDSLSDIGNFPEPYNHIKNTKPPYNLYVPISNPVKDTLYGQMFHIPLEEKAKWQYPDGSFLKQSSLRQGQINGKNKHYRSTIWPQYFVYNSLKNQLLIPSVRVYESKTVVVKNTSINYAWAGATTVDGYTYDNYTKASNVNSTKELYEIRQNYANGKIATGNVVIPGLQKQVTMYLNDLQNSKVQENTNTAYIIYIGANDIAANLVNNLLKFKIFTFLKTIGLISGKGIIASNVKQAVSKLIKAQAQNIYVLNSFNLSHLPSAHSTGLVGWFKNLIIRVSVNSYNNQLATIFQQEEYASKVKVLPLGDELNSLATGTRFSHSMQNGLACIDDKALDATTPKPVNINNCHYENMAYFAWNNSHLSTKVQQYIAYRLYQQIKTTNNPNATD